MIGPWFFFLPIPKGRKKRTGRRRATRNKYTKHIHKTHTQNLDPGLRGGEGGMIGWVKLFTVDNGDGNAFFDGWTDRAVYACGCGRTYNSYTLHSSMIGCAVLCGWVDGWM